MTAFIPTALLLLAAAGGFGGAAISDDSTPMNAMLAPQDEQQDPLAALQAAAVGMNQRDRLLRTVFVVPGPGLAPEGIEEIGQDLAIMCRIFDKASVWAEHVAANELGRNVPVDVSGIEISEHWIHTQALYLDGYGAVFFLRVGFPLAAPRNDPGPAKPQAGADPLWTQTANELRGAAQRTDRAPGPQYDERKVENLKTALIGTLRHAANLRTRGAQDVLSIVIGTRIGQTGGPELIIGSMSPYGDPFMQTRPVLPTPDSSDLANVLILQTNKADVDALAKGQLTQEQFVAKVRTFKSWTSPGPEAASRTTGSAISVPSSR